VRAGAERIGASAVSTAGTKPREEVDLADNIQTGGDGSGHGGLYFIVGALVVVVGIGAFFLLGGQGPSSSPGKTEIKIEAPKAPTKTQ
jgi:hypothetical protein